MGHEVEPAKPAQEQGSLVCVGLTVLYCKVDKPFVIYMYIGQCIKLNQRALRASSFM